MTQTRKLIFLIFLIIVIAALFYKIGNGLLTTKRAGFPKPEDIKFLGLGNLDENSNASSALSLRVISANLIAEFEAVPETVQPAKSNSPTPSTDLPPITQISQISPSPSTSSPSATLIPTSPPMRIKSLRILGDLENNGIEVARSATPLVTFYDIAGQKISVKVANFSDGYNFPEISPNEKYIYDIVIKDLPEGFQNLNITFKASSSPAKVLAAAGLPISKVLKLQERDIEENVATGSADQIFHYYRFKGKMVNTSKDSMKNTSVVAVAKDGSDRVFAWAKQDFPSDLFSKNQKQNINILLTPFKESIAENFDVYLFGEKL